MTHDSGEHNAWVNALSVLARRVRSALADGSAAIRIAVPFEGGDILAILRCVDTGLRFYWSARDGGLEVAGLGVCDRCECAPACDESDVLGQVEARLASAPEGARYYGGMRFDSIMPSDDAWREFGAGSFVLPRIEVVRRGEQCELVCNILAEESGDATTICAEIEALAACSGGTQDGNPVLMARVDTPDREGGQAHIQAALEMLGRDALEKIVLARRASLRFDKPVDAWRVLARLKAATPGCFHFGWQPAGGAAFLGASPERLYLRQGCSLETEAVAGTRTRGRSEDEDAALAQALLSSDKDRREHLVVSDSVCEVLRPLSAIVSRDRDMSLLRLARSQHLLTRIRAELNAHVSDAELVSCLHPTPAVGGWPTVESLRLIREWEGFDRGWYAGPFGWLGRGGAEMAVAIRSALVDEANVSLFSGAGIVVGSDPAEEWAEIEHKIQDFISILSEDEAS